ncbi:hypothetical protein SD436_10165 [Streptococcus sp. 2A/TPW/M5]
MQTKITRPPYGAINNAIQYGVDQSFIMWDVDSLDWKTHNTTAILNEVKKKSNRVRLSSCMISIKPRLTLYRPSLTTSNHKAILL